MSGLKKMSLVGLCVVIGTFSGTIAEKNTPETGDKKPSFYGMPMQVPIHHEAVYRHYREKVSTAIDNTKDQCAKFVNRQLLTRFGIPVFGNAWDMQLHPDNQRFLELAWQLPEEEYDAELRLTDPEDRVKHFRVLYAQLDRESYPLGVLGFVYRFSFHRAAVAAEPNVLPQTHVAFLAGRESFYFENEAEKPQTLREVIEGAYGIIHDFEEDFIAERVPLEKILQPGQRYYYRDYLIEEQFKVVQSRSLLSAFLEKHEHNRTTPLVRPVSYSQMRDWVIADVRGQRQRLRAFGPIEFVSGHDFVMTDFPGKSEWTQILADDFGMERPDKELVVPILVGFGVGAISPDSYR